MPKLTKRLVESAEPADKDYIIFDDELKGFGLRVRPTGRKIFLLQYRHGKQVRRFAIGLYPVFNPEQARTEALKLLSAVHSGNDPAGEKKAYNEAPTVHDLAARYLKEHCETHLKPATQRNNKSMLNNHILPAIGHYKVIDVKRADIANLHHKMAKKPVNANRMLEVISKMFNLAEIWGWRDEGTNPRRQIKKYPEKRRERYLSKEEAERLGRALYEIKHYPDENLAAAYCFQLLMFTGCRLGEILTLKWDYVDYEKQCLNLPDSKTGAKATYVGKVVLDVLREISNHPARPKSNPYVIWGQKENEHLKDIRKAWDRICKMAELKEFRRHDMRHSFASFALNDDITSLPMIGALLGHSQVQTTAGYAHLMNKKKQQAASDVSEQISNIMVLKPAVVADDPAEDEKPAVEIVAKTNIQIPVYLTSDQAAEYLSVAPRLMENWRWRKVGPKFIKVGSRVRYRLDDLDAFTQQQNQPLPSMMAA